MQFERAWVVSGTRGEYSDTRWWVVCVCETEADALAVVDRLQEAVEKRPEFDAYETDDEEARALAVWKFAVAAAGDASVLEYLTVWGRQEISYSAVDVPVTSPLAAKSGVR